MLNRRFISKSRGLTSNSLMLVFLLFSLVSCSTYSDSEIKEFDKQISKAVRKSGKKLTKSESGLYYLILDKGEGRTVRFSDELTFTYVGRLLDGKVFDQRYARKPITFKLSQLIEAWKEVMMYLKPGGKAIIYTPPQLAYGDHQLDAIPPNSCLYFEVELISVQ